MKRKYREGKAANLGGTIKPATQGGTELNPAAKLSVTQNTLRIFIPCEA